MKQCQVEGCGRFYYAKGFCKLHYGHFRKYGATYPVPLWQKSSGICSVVGCGRKYHANGYCDRHWQQFEKYGEIVGDVNKTKFDPNDYEICGDFCKIYLCDNLRVVRGCAMVNTADLESVITKKWHLSTAGYAVSDDGNLQLSAFILGHKLNKMTVVDHINQDKLDDRRENLRIASKSVNAFNSKLREDNTSGIRGVSWDKARSKWTARITVEKKVITLGRFDNIKDAIRERKKAELKYYGKD